MMTPRRKTTAVTAAAGQVNTLDITAPCGTPYLTTRGIAYPTDPKIIKRLLDGEGDLIPWEARGMKEVPAGEVVTDIPVCSVGGLLDKGAIVPPPAEDEEGTDEAE